MQPAIVLERLTKRYPGADVDAVHNLSLTIQSGQVFGFLGPNGAGKSTTITMLINLMQPSSGAIHIFGKNVLSEGLEIRAQTGYLTGDMALDKGLTGWQQIEYFGRLRGRFDKIYVKELAERLDCNLHKKIKTLSRGNRQKVGLIAALMHRPKLLILDEPTSGLDPIIQAEFNKIVLEHKAAGNTAFISSHVLSEVQELCDQVAIIRKGQLVANKPLSEIVGEAPKKVRLVTKGPAQVKQHLDGLRGVHHATTDGTVLSFTFDGDMNALTKQLAKVPLQNLSITDTDLEEIFMQYYEGRHAA